MACDTRENKKKQRGEKSVSKGGRQKWEHEKRKEEEEEEKKKKSRGEIKKKKSYDWGQLAVTIRLEFRFYYRCSRDFSSCKVIVKRIS